MIPEFIHIPSDEDEAAAVLSYIVEARPEIGARTQLKQFASGSARAILKSLIDDGIFAGRISDYDARCFQEEISRYEAEGQERADAEVERRPGAFDQATNRILTTEF